MALSLIRKRSSDHIIVRILGFRTQSQDQFRCTDVYLFNKHTSTQQSKAGQTEDLNQGARNKKEQAIKHLSALLNKLYGRGRARLRNFIKHKLTPHGRKTKGYE